MLTKRRLLSTRARPAFGCCQDTRDPNPSLLVLENLEEVDSYEYVTLMLSVGFLLLRIQWALTIFLRYKYTYPS